MKRFTAAFLVLLLLFCGTKPVSATAPTPEYSQHGADRTGVAINDNDSPLEVERTQLTFDISEFPKEEYESDAAFLAYTGKVTTQYTLYNPTDTAVSAKLLFYTAGQPEYGRSDPLLDEEKYTVLVDGEAAAKTLRHSLGSQRFRTDRDLLWDTYVEDPFYHPDMPVTAYWFTVSGLDSERYSEAAVAFDLPAEFGSRRFYLKDTNIYHEIDGGSNLRLVSYAKNDQLFCLYVIGEPLTEMPQWKFYQNRSARDSEQVAGTAAQLYSETLTFKELVLRNWSEDMGVSEIDWYNATVEDINDNSFSRAYPAVFYPDKPVTFESRLVRWYEYEITVQPQQRVVTTAAAPIYPYVREGYEPAVYEYNYLFYPDRTWQSFGKLEIVINTPYYLIDSYPNFQKTETGYKLSLDSLPEYDLTFELCESESPERTRSNWVWFILLIAPFVLIAEAFEAIGEFFTNLFQNLF